MRAVGTSAEGWAGPPRQGRAIGPVGSQTPCLHGNLPLRPAKLQPTAAAGVVGLQSPSPGPSCLTCFSGERIQQVSSLSPQPVPLKGVGAALPHDQAQPPFGQPGSRDREGAKRPPVWVCSGPSASLRSPSSLPSALCPPGRRAPAGVSFPKGFPLPSRVASTQTPVRRVRLTGSGVSASGWFSPVWFNLQTTSGIDGAVLSGWEGRGHGGLAVQGRCRKRR